MPSKFTPRKFEALYYCYSLSATYFHGDLKKKCNIQSAIVFLILNSNIIAIPFYHFKPYPFSFSAATWSVKFLINLYDTIWNWLIILLDVEGQPESIVQDIENMVRSYIEKVKCIWSLLCAPSSKIYLNKIYNDVTANNILG